MDIRCNLRDDLNTFAEGQMQSKGYKWQKNHKISSFHQYMNLLNREVTPKPREVRISNEFSCPNELMTSFNTFINDLRLGYNVNAYLSSNLKRAGYNDGFLNDFGLHHFHLGIGICNTGKSKGFINRTGPVLVAYVTDKTAYLIGIYEHGENASLDLWTDQFTIEIIHNEWPEVLSAFKIHGISPSPEPITTEQRKVLRSKSCNSFIEMPDGVIYAPMGGGVTSANTNTNLTIQFDIFYSDAKLILNELCLYINNSSDYRMNYPVNLTLISINSGYVFNDKNNDIHYFVSTIDSCNLQISQIFHGVLPAYYPHLNLFKVNEISGLIIANRN
jgi:hypothetical protein